jgi:hypothetical protein
MDPLKSFRTFFRQQDHNQLDLSGILRENPGVVDCIVAAAATHTTEDQCFKLRLMTKIPSLAQSPVTGSRRHNHTGKICRVRRCWRVSLKRWNKVATSRSLNPMRTLETEGASLPARSLGNKSTTQPCAPLSRCRVIYS